MLVWNFRQPHALALFGLNLLSSVPRKYLEIIVFRGFRCPKSLNINLYTFCRPIWKYCCAINSPTMSNRHFMKLYDQFSDWEWKLSIVEKSTKNIFFNFSMFLLKLIWWKQIAPYKEKQDQSYIAMNVLDQVFWGFLIIN